jgi:hypothetical protein
MRPAATLLATLAMALGAVGLAVAGPGREVASERLAAATGSVHISNSLEGRAIFGAEALRPGASTTGTVRIGNDGNVRSVVTLTGTRDPETGLVSLANSLQLTVADVDDALTLYSGPAAGFTTVAVGSLDVGESRELRFTATLPSSAGNALQGASTTLGLLWSASAAPGATPTPTPTATPRPGKPAAPRKPATPTTPAAPALPAGEALADAIGMPRKGTRVRKRKLRMRLHALGGAKVLALKVSVNGKLRKRVKGSRSIVKVNLKKLKGRKVKIAVTIRASDGRRYTARRTYKVARKRR